MNIPIIILAGGKGERFIGKDKYPKQLSKVSDKPILIEIILYYYKKGFNFFILPLGHNSKIFQNFFENKENIKKYRLNLIKKKKYQLQDCKINIILFSAGSNSNKLNRISKSIEFICNNQVTIFGVCYGDVFANVNFKKLLNLLENNKIHAVLTGFMERSPYGHIKIDKKKRILSFIEKPIMLNPINIGFYFFKKKFFLKHKFKLTDDLETFLLPKLSKRLKLSCFIHEKFHFTINTQKDLIAIKKKYKTNKTFFKNQ